MNKKQGNEQKIEENNMLKLFSVENFRCFGKKLTLDLSANDYAFNSDIVKNKLVNKKQVKTTQVNGNQDKTWVLKRYLCLFLFSPGLGQGGGCITGYWGVSSEEDPEAAH